MAIVINTENLAFTVNKNTEWIADTFADIAGVLDGQYVYVKDTDEIWYKENGNIYEVTKNHGNVSTSKIFPDSYGQNVRIATAIIRPTIDVSGNVSWSFVNDGEHQLTFFNAISTPNSSSVRISHTPVSKILSFNISNDNATNRFGIACGASVGLNFSDVFFTATFETRQIITWNGSSWANSGQVFTSSVVNSGNTIVINIPTGGFVNIESSYANINAVYSGTNNVYIRQVYSGLGYFQTKYELINPITGLSVAPAIGDRIILFNPSKNLALNTQTSNTSHGLEKHVYDATISPNYWVMAIYIE